MIQFVDSYYNNSETYRDTMIQLCFPNGWTYLECGYTEYKGLKLVIVYNVILYAFQMENTDPYNYKFENAKINKIENLLK